MAIDGRPIEPGQLEIIGAVGDRVLFEVEPSSVEPQAIRFTPPADLELGVVRLQVQVGGDTLAAGNLSLRRPDDPLIVEGASRTTALPDGRVALGAEPGSVIRVSAGDGGALELHLLTPGDGG